MPVRGPADFLALGDWNASCSICGRKRKASTMVQNWQGMWRCPEHNESRQPQDFVRGIPERVTPPWVQPPGADMFTFNTGNVNTDGTDYTLADLAGSTCTGSPTLITVAPGVTATITLDSSATFLVNNYGFLTIVIASSDITRTGVLTFSSSCGTSEVRNFQGGEVVDVTDGSGAWVSIDNDIAYVQSVIDHVAYSTGTQNRTLALPAMTTTSGHAIFVCIVSFQSHLFDPSDGGPPMNVVDNYGNIYTLIVVDGGGFYQEANPANSYKMVRKVFWCPSIVGGTGHVITAGGEGWQTNFGRTMNITASAVEVKNQRVGGSLAVQQNETVGIAQTTGGTNLSDSGAGASMLATTNLLLGFGNSADNTNGAATYTIFPGWTAAQNLGSSLGGFSGMIVGYEKTIPPATGQFTFYYTNSAVQRYQACAIAIQSR